MLLRYIRSSKLSSASTPSGLWLSQITKLDGKEGWEHWNGILEAQLMLASLWDRLTKFEQVISTGNKKFITIFMLIIKGEAWIIIQNNKKRELNIFKIYKELKIEYNYINFAGIIIL